VTVEFSLPLAIKSADQLRARLDEARSAKALRTSPHTGPAEGVASNAPGNAGVVGDTVSGDVLHGRGPRRGGLQKLLKYWRPIMKKPGGFRRCVIELADHPELGDIKALCAWLHHETTGRWPGEGHGRRRGPSARGEARAAVTPGKSAAVDVLTEFVIENQDWLHASMPTKTRRKKRGMAMRHMEGVYGSASCGGKAANLKAMIFAAQGYLTVPYESAEVDEKAAARGGAGVRRITRAPLPDFASRSQRKPNPIRSAIGRGVAAPLGATRVGGGIGAARSVRCPEGYEYGGRFTAVRNRVCGRQVEDEAPKLPKRAKKPATSSVRRARRPNPNADF
jgi:hypothetical protein